MRGSVGKPAFRAKNAFVRNGLPRINPTPKIFSRHPG
jgi:hypothetical protein